MSERRRYITPEGAAALRSELDRLWRTERPEVTQKVKEAAAMGDRSENAEYIYGKRQLRSIDRRVRFLRKTLDEIVVVDRTPDDTGRVFFGAWVRVARAGSPDGPDDRRWVRIVGRDEYDPRRHWISVESPLARALIGKPLDATVTVDTPEGREDWSIESIRYGSPPP